MNQTKTTVYRVLATYRGLYLFSLEIFTTESSERLRTTPRLHKDNKVSVSARRALDEASRLGGESYVFYN